MSSKKKTVNEAFTGVVEERGGQKSWCTDQSLHVCVVAGICSVCVCVCATVAQ